MSRPTPSSTARVVALSLLVALAFSACGRGNSGDALAAAKLAIESGDYKAAAIRLKAALQDNPTLPEARFQLGRALLAQGDAVGAVVELEKARELRHPDDQVLPLLATAMLAKGDAKGVIETFGGPLLPPGEAAARLSATVAEAHFALDQMPRGEAVLASALAAKPDLPEALALDARLRFSKGDLAGARERVDRLLKAHPRQTSAWLLKGQLELLADPGSKVAVDAFREAIKLEPRSLIAYRFLLPTLIARGDFDATKAAIADIRSARGADEPEAKFFEGQVALARRDLKRAGEISEDLLKLAPDNARVLQQAGLVSYLRGSLQQAEPQLTKAVQIDPDLVAARRVLARTLVQTGQSDKALQTLDPLIRAGDDAEALTIAAQALALRGNLAEAQARYAEAAKLDPANRQIKSSLALTRLARGDNSAFADLEALATGSSDSESYITLISARLRSGDVPGALRAVDALEKAQPGQPFASSLRGQILWRRGDFAGAAKAYQRASELDPKYFPAIAALAAVDLQAGRLAEAQARLEAVLKLDPTMAEAWLGLAELRGARGGTRAEMVEMIDKAIALQPTSVAARAMLIGVHLRNADAKSALIAAQAAVAAIPNNPQLLLMLATAEERSGEYQQAVSSYGRLATLQPLDPQPHLRLANVFVAMKKQDSAVASLKRALEIQPTLVDARAKLISLALEAKDVDEALRVARAAQKDFPRAAIGWMLEGDIQLAQKNVDAGLAAYRSGLEREKFGTLAVKLHQALLDNQRSADASRFATQWLGERPKDVAFNLHLGSLAIAGRDHLSALNRFNAVLEVEPKNVLGLNNLAFTMLQLGRPGALQYAEQASALAPDQPAVMDTLALAQLVAGQVAKAAETQRKVLTLAPDIPAYHLTNARILIAQGDKQSARSELERLSRLGERFPRQAEVNELLKKL